MDLRPGYSQTEIGVIPEDWVVTPLGSLCEISAGGDLVKEEFSPVPDDQHEFPIYSNALTDRGLYGYAKSYQYEPDKITVTARGGIGHAVYRGTRFSAIGRLLVLSSKRQCDLRFVTDYINHLVDFALESTGVPQLTAPQISKYAVALPPTTAEQEAIAEALSDADALIESLERLLAKKRQIKQGAMQELLTGKKRLPGFSGEWDEKRIADIASPSSEKNRAGEPLTVLTCSKHLGFIDSLSYFKNQVFSRDTSGYKIIRRGELGYPSNHVEEGSIGVQELYDVALVSPIYVVFSVVKVVDSYFLHRLLKLDSYRQKFETATSSSVDRRGSLRWPAFSEITVTLPAFEEQRAIAAILRDMDAEMGALEAKIAKARQLKQGMMQELLTGRTRLV